MGNQEVVIHNPSAVAPIQSPRDLMPAVEQVQASLMESLLIQGDLAPLKPAERMQYYRAVCESLKLNPLTKPFDYLALNGKLTLYAKKDCTDQLRKLNDISVTFDEPKVLEGILYVKARASTPAGRRDESTGAVSFENLKGEAKANAFMKCETKAKRRVTLSICGLGFTDESELDTMSNYRVVSMDQAHTAEVIDTGGHPMNSREAQEYVRDQKIAKQTTSAGNTGSTPPSSQGQKGQGTHRSGQAEPGHPREQSPVPPTNDPLSAAVADFRAADKYGRLRIIRDAKADIEELTGADLPYYEILSKHIPKEKWRDGQPHADGFPTLGAAVKCYTELLSYITEVRASLAEPPMSEPPMSADKFVEGLEPEVANAGN